MRNAPYRTLLKEPATLPKTLEIESTWFTIPDSAGGPPGGEQAGVRKMSQYFCSSAPSSYKNTRNSLFGDDYSTGLSAYLAHGCLSPLQVFDEVQRYEADVGKSQSTHWIVLELLWREFFRWYGLNYRDKLFEFSGINDKRPLTSFYFDRFASWRTGHTQWPIVNACMRELNATGHLSNRGRQIAASCLINDLNVDWRCGAAYFAEKLIDYDPCSNWGNWQYIAGVGADPKGGRQFNLERQAATFDADRSYQKYWGA